jgi:hypothetical protein
MISTAHGRPKQCCSPGPRVGPFVALAGPARATKGPFVAHARRVHQ